MSPNVMVDRISVLPHNIIDSILTRLKIKEAARTCILSRSWRYQWHFLPKINIKFGDFRVVPEAEFVKIIDHILHVHRGLVVKLELSIDLVRNDIIDQLILYVSRNGVKELVINNWNDELYSISSCLFQCSDLTYLRLTNCMVKPPAAFKGFCNLTMLSFSDVIIDDKVLENVISSCPLLSLLSLEAADEPPPSLKINAPNLVELYILGFNHFPQLMNTPLLDFAEFELICCEASANEDCKIIQLLGSMPVLRRLELKYNALQHLAVGDVPARLPFVCPIKYLMVHIDFEDLQDLLVAFCIFRSSPFIQHLEIMASSDGLWIISSDGFWKGEDDFSFKFDHLQTVKVYSFKGIESELMFVKFILSNAPALKTIMFISYFSGEVEEATVVTKLSQFPRISPNAELIFDSQFGSMIATQ